MKRMLRRAAALLAVPALALSIATVASTPASALEVDAIIASIELNTEASIVGDVLRIKAEGETLGQLVPNVTVLLHVEGVEHWVDSSGNNQVTPIVASPSSVSFTTSTSVTFTQQLHANSTVQVNYEAEVVGALPTGALQCAGEVLRVGGGVPFIVKTC